MTALLLAGLSREYPDKEISSFFKVYIIVPNIVRFRSIFV